MSAENFVIATEDQDSSYCAASPLLQMDGRIVPQSGGLHPDFHEATIGGAGMLPYPPRLSARWQAIQRLIGFLPPVERMHHRTRLLGKMRRELGYVPNLRRPRTFNERVACKILHDRDPLIPLTTDKVAVRGFVSTRIGTDTLIPLHGVWERPSDVPWDSLPDRFVAKANHGCGYNLIVTDKSALRREDAERLFAAWLGRSYYRQTGEWGYRDIPPRLLVEDLLAGDNQGVPEDYKFYCFNGTPHLLQVHLDRFSNHRFLWYDPRTLAPLAMGQTRHDDVPGFAPQPAARALLPLVARLAAGFDAVRVDFYLVDGRPYFGELTHYPGGAVVPLESRGQDLRMGEMWRQASLCR